MDAQPSITWRRPDFLGKLRVFKVDHPASQAWKRGRVAELGLPTSENHVFAPVDFEVQSLRDSLDAVGFDWTQPTMFSWLGVIVYLSMDAVVATFRTVAVCRSASEVALEYVLTEEFVEDIGPEYKAIFSPLVGSLADRTDGLQPLWGVLLLAATVP